MDTGTVENVTVGEITAQADYSENDIIPDFAKSGDDVGGFVGKMYGGTIENSTTSAVVTGQGDNIGGFAGSLSGWFDEEPITINSSVANGSVDGLGHDDINSTGVGGFVGSNQSGFITYSSTTADVEVVHHEESYNSYSVGGFAGESICGAIIEYSFAEGDVTAPNANSVGGFTGSDGCEGPGTEYFETYATGDVIGGDSVGGFLGGGSYTAIQRAYATGSVDGNNYVGGLVGWQSGGGYDYEDPESAIYESFALGDVTATDQSAGGLIGVAQGIYLADSFAQNNVSGASEVGGLVGVLSGKYGLFGSYAAGTLSSDEEQGGLVGYASDTEDEADAVVESAYWDTELSGESYSPVGTGKNTAQMIDMATFVDWDFEEIWGLEEGEYPCLQWTEVGCLMATPSTEDLNGDTIPDVDQPHVGGYISPVTGKQVAMDMGEGCELNMDDITEEVYLPTQDPGYDYANGLFHFAADCGEEGYTTTIRLFYYDVRMANLVVRKFNPNTYAYFNLSGDAFNASLSETTINGHIVTVATYDITDGGLLDMDETPGEIEDPVGLANLLGANTVGVPNTGLRR